MNIEKNIIVLSSITMFISLTDINIINVAYPFIAKFFNVDMSKISILSIGFLMMLAISIPILGKLNDIIGIRKIFLAGYAIFSITGILCALSPTLNFLIFSRGLQGIGAGMLSISSTASIVTYIPNNKKGSALGIMAMAGSLGLISGSPLGGFLTDWFGWRAIFWVLVPTSLIILFYAHKTLPYKKDISIKNTIKEFNFKGAIYITIFTAFFVFMMIKYIKTHKITETDFIMSAICIASLSAFIYNEANSSKPLLGISILKDTHFLISIVVNMLVVIMLSINIFFIPFLLSSKFLLSAKTIGLVMLIFSITYGIVGILIGKIIDKSSPEIFCLIGIIFLLFTNTFFYMTFNNLNIVKISVILFCLGVSFSCFIIPVSKLILSKPDSSNAGSITAIFRTTRQYASLLGIVTVAIISKSSSDQSIDFLRIIKYEIFVSIPAIVLLFILILKIKMRGKNGNML